MLPLHLTFRKFKDLCYIYKSLFYQDSLMDLVYIFHATWDWSKVLNHGTKLLEALFDLEVKVADYEI